MVAAAPPAELVAPTTAAQAASGMFWLQWAGQPPVAGDDRYTTAQNTRLVVAPGVMSNDSDANGDVLSVRLVTDVTSGTLVLNLNGSFTYTPVADWTGTAQFTYRVWDGTSFSHTATVTITVTK